MDWPWNFLVYSIILSLLALLFLIPRRSSNLGHDRLPARPPGLPLFGNMFDLGTMPHRTLAELKHKFGPVIWLRLGASNTMVIQSAKAAANLFKNHGISFAGRTTTEASQVYDYHKGSLALAPYGSHWRVLRRLVTVDMLVNKRINETAFIRKKCLEKLQLWIEEEASELKEGHGVHVARFVFLMSFNLLGNLMLSKDLADPNLKEGSEFFTAMTGMMEWNGHANMADFFPWPRWLDPQGLKRKMNRDLVKALKIAARFMRQSMKDKQLGGVRTRDFLDVLLEFEGNGIDEPAKISDHDVNIFVLDIRLPLEQNMMKWMNFGVIPFGGCS